jgi:hypothetical protein
MKADPKRWHNQGQEDAAKGQGNFDPPDKSFIEELVEGYSAEELTNIEAYKEGWRNGDKQR